MSDENKALFVHLVMMLGSSAMQNLGKVMNPITKKTEVNLEAAQASIDLLDMLEAKTKGNLGDDESRLLKATLADLKINYVETAHSPAASAAPSDAPAKEEPIENKRFSKKFD
jgi:hypothetical protein